MSCSGRFGMPHPDNTLGTQQHLRTNMGLNPNYNNAGHAVEDLAVL